MKQTVQSETVSQITTQTVTPDSTKSKVYFFKYDREVSEDIGLQKTTCALYTKLLGRTNIRTRTVRIYIAELAKLLNCSKWTIRRHLRKLIDMGLVDRILSKSRNNPKMNIASLFIVHGADALRYKGSQDTEAEQPDDETRAKMCGGTHKIALQKTESIYLESESKGTNLTGKLELPLSSSTYSCMKEEHSQEEATTPTPAENQNPSQPEVSVVVSEAHQAKVTAQKQENPKTQNHAPNPLEQDMTGIPTKLIPTVRLLLTLSWRTKLEDYEIRCLLELAKKHTLTRINVEIEKQAENFRKRGRNMKSLKANYIYKILMGQPATLKPEATRQTGKYRNMKGVKSEHTGQGAQVVALERVSEPAVVDVAESKAATMLTMPLADAEKVIAEYSPAPKKQPEFPVALSELFSQILAQEEVRRLEYLDSLPKDYDGEDETWSRHMTLEDYLHLKFPDASDEELHRDANGRIQEDYSSFPDGQEIKLAFEVDYACARCYAPEDCSLPRGCRKGSMRPNVRMGQDYKGEKCLRAGWGGCLKCRHDYPDDEEYLKKKYEAENLDPEVERKLKASGIAPTRWSSNFDAYVHENATPEVVVAKAQAILAAQKKTNLILGGKAGTGKTHLAIAIALDAIKAGRKAIMRSVPELLDELRRANQEHTDPYGLMMKYKSVECLVLDDFGKEKNTEAGWDYLYQIIDYRYTHELQTIVTTNAYDMSGLEKKWNEDKVEPLVSRILANGEWVTIENAENYRLRQSEKPSVSDVDSELSVLEPVSEDLCASEDSVVSDRVEMSCEPTAEDSDDDELCAREESSAPGLDRESEELVKVDKPTGNVLSIPQYDDGLDDDPDEDLKIYCGLYSD